MADTERQEKLEKSKEEGLAIWNKRRGVVVLGDEGCGKKMLVRRLCFLARKNWDTVSPGVRYPYMPAPDELTWQFDRRYVAAKTRKSRFICDVNGTERELIVIPGINLSYACNYAGRNLVSETKNLLDRGAPRLLLCFSLRSLTSLQRVCTIYDQLLLKYDKEHCVAFIGCQGEKSLLASRKRISDDQVVKRISRYDSAIYFPTSASDGQGIQDVLSILLQPTFGAIAGGLTKAAR